MGPEASIPLSYQAMAELLRLLLKSLYHGCPNIFIMALIPLKPEGHIHMDITWWNRSGLYGWWTTYVSTYSMSSPWQYRCCLDGHGCATLHPSWAFQTLSWLHVNAFEGSMPAAFTDRDFRVLQHSAGKGLLIEAGQRCQGYRGTVITAASQGVIHGGDPSYGLLVGWKPQCPWVLFSSQNNPRTVWTWMCLISRLDRAWMWQTVNTKNDPSHSHLHFKIACYLSTENLDIFNSNNLPYKCDKHNITIIQHFLLHTLRSTFMKWHTYLKWPSSFHIINNYHIHLSY